MTEQLDDGQQLVHPTAILLLVQYFPMMPLVAKGRLLKDLMLLFKNSVYNRQLLLKGNGGHLNLVWYESLVALMQQQHDQVRGADGPVSINDGIIKSYVDIMGWLMGETVLSSVKQSKEIILLTSMLLRPQQHTKPNENDDQDEEKRQRHLQQAHSNVIHCDVLHASALLCTSIACFIAAPVERHVLAHPDDWHKRNSDGTYNSERIMATNIIQYIAFVETLLLQGRKTFNGDPLMCYDDVAPLLEREREIYIQQYNLRSENHN